MPVPSAITDLSQTAGSNSPGSNESPVTADDYMRALSAFIAQHRDGQGFSAEVDLASAATCSIGAQTSPFVRITGTTTITSFGAVTALPGPRFVRFADALTLTHDASSLILPGGANITTAAGDTCIVTPKSSGWVVSQYTRATNEVTAQATTSGTEWDLSFPAGVSEIDLLVDEVSFNASATAIFRLGDAGGFEATNYESTSASVTSAVSAGVDATTGFALLANATAGNEHTGTIRLRKKPGTNTWIATGMVRLSGGPGICFVAGSKTLSDTLTSVRLTTTAGTATGDNGSISARFR